MAGLSNDNTKSKLWPYQDADESPENTDDFHNVRLMTDKRTLIFLNIGVAIIIALFGISLLRNLSYPLLWNDEAETVMFGKRIVQYGYPKVNDGKNLVYTIEDRNRNIGIREGSFIGLTWGQFYVAAVADHLARLTDDLYLKTALLRLPFALIGLASIIYFSLIFSQFFGRRKKEVIILFFCFELLSISLVLHLREVRYYSLAFLFAAFLVDIFLRYHFVKNLKFKFYLFGLALSLVLLFHTYHPFALAFMIAFGAYGLILSLKGKNGSFWCDLLKTTSPLLLSLVFIIPSMVFYKTIAIARELSLLYKFNISVYFNNIHTIFSYFARFEFLCLAIFLKLLLVSLFLHTRRAKDSWQNCPIAISNFLTFLFGAFILVMARMPLMFERYILIGQPILVGVIIFDIYSCWVLFTHPSTRALSTKKETAIIFVMVISVVFGLNVIPKIESIKGHVYELTHRYRGPLDYAITYIRENFVDTSKLIIATNYEEGACMYYLDSKVIVGYLGNNLAQDSTMQPDIIIFRKSYPFIYPDIFNAFLEKGDYRKVSLPVFDYPVNNIAELDFKFSHLYKTKLAANEAEKLDIYLKQDYE